MEPMRPTIEEKASSVWRYSVGYSSDVYRYREVNTIEMLNLPSRYIIIATTSNSEKITTAIKPMSYMND